MTGQDSGAGHRESTGQQRSPGLREAMGMVGRGAAMGAADVVPGVSGGTIALLTGIYDRLIGSLGDGARGLGRLVRGDLRGAVLQLRRLNWTFIIPLLVGLLGAVALLAGVVEGALIDHPEPMAGLFLGLVTASVMVAQREVAWTVWRLVVTGIVGLTLFVALGWQGPPVTDPSALALFASGAVAI